MALTRKLLKGLGLTDEQIDSIVDAHGETVDALKKQITDLTGQIDGLKTAQTELESLKTGDYKTKFEGVKKELDDLKADIAGKEQAAKAKAAYRKRLEALGIDSKRFDAIIRATDLSKLTLNAEGELADEASVDKAILEDWGDFKVTTSTKGESVPTPPTSGGKTMTRAEIYKKDEHGRYVLTTEQRQKALAENPELLK